MPNTVQVTLSILTYFPLRSRPKYVLEKYAVNIKAYEIESAQSVTEINGIVAIIL